MEAVKMPKVVQPRGQARSVSGASSDAAKGSDEFMKLLQVKKDHISHVYRIAHFIHTDVHFKLYKFTIVKIITLKIPGGGNF